MSMLDSFFNRGFRGSKCKTMLKLTIPRIKLLRNRRELQVKQMRKEIAKLLETGQEATARIRVEHIIREDNMMAAQEIIELFCELISVRLPMIESQRECPLDLKEAIASVCFAAPRCADLPELQQVQLEFASKYGKEFLAAATELRPDCGVNRQLIGLLSVRAPPAEKKLMLLKEIAEGHGVDWDPAGSETELFKSHEDLLNGTAQYGSGNQVPLPKEKHEETLQSAPSKVADEEYDSDPGLDFPEVPTIIMRPFPGSAFTKDDDPAPSAPNPEVNHGPVIDFENLLRQPSKGLGEDTSLGSDLEMPRSPEPGQFVPYMSATSLSSQSLSFNETDATFESVERVKSEKVDLSLPSPPEVKSENSDTLAQYLPVKPEISFVLQDVLHAAQAAAESAERAAAAARSASILAHLRISELSNKQNVQSHDSDSLPDNPFGMEHASLSATPEKQHFERQFSSADSDDSAKAAHCSMQPEHAGSSLFTTESSGLLTYDSNESLFKTSSFDEALEQVNPQHPPQRMTFVEDDTLASFPNLFGSGGHSFTETSRSNS